MQTFRRNAAGRVVVARDIEAVQGRRKSRAARWLAERPATMGRSGRTDLSASIVSIPSPAASTSSAMPKRTPLPSRWPSARRGSASGALLR